MVSPVLITLFSELLIWANGLAWNWRCLVVGRKGLRDLVGKREYWVSGK